MRKAATTTSIVDKQKKPKEFQRMTFSTDVKPFKKPANFID